MSDNPRHSHPDRTPFEARQIEEAAREAAAIGGHVRHAGTDRAKWPLDEAGEGVAEGFELAEQDLIAAAEHADGPGDPLADAIPPERGAREQPYGEADHEASAEAPETDR